MKSIKEEYPNPVLADGRDDYIDKCSFYSEFDEQKITVDTDNINVPIQYFLHCKGLNDLIQTGEAVAVVIINNAATSYRRVHAFKPFQTLMTVPVPKYAVAGKIELYTNIIAAKDISNFDCPNEFNPMYFSGVTFRLRKGDILATEPIQKIDIDDSELEKPIQSIFRFTKNENPKYSLEPNFADEKIEIFLKPELHNLYNEMNEMSNGMLRRYVMGVMVYPALVEAVKYVLDGSHLDEDSHPYSDYRWYKAIEVQSRKKGYDLTDDLSSVTIANDLLGDIALEALLSIKDTLDQELNSGETTMIGGVD